MEAFYYHRVFLGIVNKLNGFYAFIHVHQSIFFEYYVVVGSSQGQSPASTKTLSDDLHAASDWNRNVMLQAKSAVLPAVKFISQYWLAYMAFQILVSVPSHTSWLQLLQVTLYVMVRSRSKNNANIAGCWKSLLGEALLSLLHQLSWCLFLLR